MTNIRLLGLVFCGLLAATPDIAPAVAQDGMAPGERFGFGITASDRSALQSYLALDTYCFRRLCPGDAHYAPGTYLPQTIVPETLPTALVSRLATPPLGAEYVRAPGGIYLVDRDSRLILDRVSRN
jgi:hypothetical protein